MPEVTGRRGTVRKRNGFESSSDQDLRRDAVLSGADLWAVREKAAAASGSN